MSKVIGTKPWQTPRNADLGTLAYINHKTAYFNVSTTTQSATGGSGGDATYVWDSITYDNLGGFDTSTGMYTAQESGIYIFTYTMTPSSASTSTRYFRARFKRIRNGSTVTLYNPHQTISDATGDNDYNSLSATVIENVQVGDKFYISYGFGVDASAFTFYSDMNWFSGVKLI